MGTDATKTITVGESAGVIQAASGVTNNIGISELDQFRLTDNLTANADPISSNLERIDDATFSKIGTGMSLSSGIYTFPQTGVYQVSVNAEFQISQDTTADCETQVSSDSGSSYDQTAVAVGGMQGSNFNTNNSSSQCYVNVSPKQKYIYFVLSLFFDNLMFYRHKITR